MAISQFPAPAAGGATNDFILDKNNTTNTTFDLGRDFAAGGYSVVVTGSTAYDIYLLNSSGSAVGYTNADSLVASDRFISASVLGLGTADSVAFTYSGPSTNASAIGNRPGAGAFLTSITPSDLGQLDDTAVVSGGNFAENLEISFISGTVVLPAKNVVVGSSTAAVVTRPDALIEDEAPYDLVAINPDAIAPTGSNANVLLGTVTAGTDPTFITTSPILGAAVGVSFSTAILASDAEGSVISWAVTAGTLPDGLALGTADGTLAGTPTTGGNNTFTVTIFDDAGNSNFREFELPVGPIVTGGSVVTTGGFTYHVFTSSDTLSVVNGTKTAEILVVAGGGGGGNFADPNSAGGGGGAGGLVFGTATIPEGANSITVGAAGAIAADGNNSLIAAVSTAIAGGKGGSNISQNGSAGGSGGGGSRSGSGGAGTSGQGFAGGSGQGGDPAIAGGGGGAGEVGNTDAQGFGGDGANYSAFASAIGIVYNGGFFAGGGGGGNSAQSPGATIGGEGGGGDGCRINITGATAGSANSGGGGGGGGRAGGGFQPSAGAAAGGSGLVVVRYS